MAKNLRTIDNNSAYAIVNAAYKQAVGAAAVDTLDLSDFCDSGVAYDSLQVGRDKFLKALIDQVVNFYNDTSYSSEYTDPYYVESRRFANIVQMINAAAPEVQASHAWKDMSPNTGTTPPTYATIGTYAVKPPTVQTDYFTKSVSWELPLAITTEQLTDAFKSDSELRGFVDYIFVVVSNALQAHRENMNSANRNSFMGHKIYAHQEAVPGIHKVNLLTAYNADRGKSLTTVAGFLADPDALRYAGAQIVLYEKYLRKQSTLFNTKGLVKFCPADRMVLEVNSAFENAINEVALSTTFHDELVSMPNHISVPAWQGFGINSADPSTSAAAFDQVTKIDVTLDTEASNSNVSISQSGIVALLADKYAIMHTIRQERVAAQYFEMEDITLYAYQNRDQYVNNLAQNAVVFTVEAPSQPGPSSLVGLGDIKSGKGNVKVLNKNGKE